MFMNTIKELREKNCLTQEDVMKVIGMESRSNYSKIEHKKQKPRLHTRKLLADLFNVNPWDIDF